MAKWSNIRKKLEKEYLCKALQEHIQYYAISYSKSPDHNGRAAIRFDGKEILKSSYHEIYPIFCNNCNDYKNQYIKTIDNGCFDQTFFYKAFEIFDNQSIEKSLSDDNALIRVFAILDRRVGKRRLLKLKENMENELEWVKMFYNIRIKAENIT